MEAEQYAQTLQSSREQDERWTQGAQPVTHRDEWNRKATNNARQEQLARALGWFSIGVGLMEVAAPQAVAKLTGVNDNRALLRALGLREIANGVGILSRRKPAGWLWARVGGDIMDLAFLGAALNSPNTNRRRIAAATAAVTGVALLDLRCSQQFSRAAASDRSIRVRKSITINHAPEDLYRFWHDFQNLPRFMKHLESVQETDEKRSHWVAKGPAGKKVEWDAEIRADQPNELIAWRSLEGADVENSGSVRFERAPGGRGTVIRLEMHYRPPGGVFGATIATFFGEEPRQQVEEDLRRFKQLMEAGDIITTEGQPAGRKSSTSRKYDQIARTISIST
ncbi:MAG: SRPBCC family protein [Candidatus Binatia bacterium]